MRPCSSGFVKKEPSPALVPSSSPLIGKTARNAACAGAGRVPDRVQHDAEWARRAQRELRELLNQWDPIEVFDPADQDSDVGPVDEYDCLCDPLISRLLRGDGRAAVAEFLRHELTNHYGLELWLVTTNLISRIFDWWETVQ